MSDWERRYKAAIEQTEVAMKVNEQLIIDKKKLQAQLDEANQEIKELYSGRLGACHTCEQVAELNIKLEQQLKEAEKFKELAFNARKMRNHEDLIRVRLMAVKLLTDKEG